MALVLLGLGLSASPSWSAEDDFELTWAGFPGGGGMAADEFFQLEGAFGLPAVDVQADDFFRLEAGFWPAALTAPPSFVATPANITVALGDPVLFEVAAAGDPPLRYEWRLNGVVIPDATNATYFVAGAQLTNGGTYTVVISNARGSTISEPFKLGFAFVRTAADNVFASRTVIAPTNVLFRGDNTNATREVGELRHAGKPGGHSVWYRWTAPDTGIATFHTTGSAFDTLLAVYTGNTIAGLTPVTANDDTRGRFLASEVRFNAVQGTEYQIVVDGLGGQEGEFVLGWELELTAEVLPVIVQAPAGRSIPFGASTVFTVNATGAGLIYQWFRDQIALPANGSSLVISDFGSADVGRYSVAITNSLGRGVATEPVTLEAGNRPTVVSFAKLAEAVGEANEDTGGGGGGGGGLFQLAGAGGGGFDSVSVGIIDGHTFNNQNALPNPCEGCGQAVGGAMQTYLLQPLGDGALTLDTMGSAIDTILYVYSNGPLSQICSRKVTCDDNGAPDGLRSLVTFPVRAGIKYLIGVDGVGGAKGSITLNWKLCLPPAPFELTEGSFTLRTPPNSQPYPDQPLYQWFRGEESLGSTATPFLPLGQPPTDAARFSVRYTTAKQGAVQQVTNQLGWVVTMTPSPNAPPGFQQLILPGMTSPDLKVEVASQTLTNCDGRWLWLPVNDYVVSTQPTSVTITLPLDPNQPGRLHRVRPAPPP